MSSGLRGSLRTVTYAEYLMPGSFFPEETTKELEQRSVEEAITKAPESAFCFVLYDRDYVPLDESQAKVVGKVEVAGPVKNESGRYYLGGKVYTVAQLKKAYPDKDILISNIEGNGYTHAIQTHLGNWQHFEPDKDELVREGVVPLGR